MIEILWNENDDQARCEGDRQDWSLTVRAQLGLPNGVKRVLEEIQKHIEDKSDQAV
jgi:hypothetical protein